MAGSLAKLAFASGMKADDEGGEGGGKKPALPSAKAIAGKKLKQALAGDDYEAIADAFSALSAECMPMAEEETEEMSPSGGEEMLYE